MIRWIIIVGNKDPRFRIFAAAVMAIFWSPGSWNPKCGVPISSAEAEGVDMFELFIELPESDEDLELIEDEYVSWYEYCYYW